MAEAMMSLSIDDVRAMLAARPAPEGPRDVAAMRDTMATTTDAMRPHEAVAITETSLGGVRGLHFKPEAAKPGRALLYFHGGGYVIGSPGTHKGLTSHIAEAMGAEAWSMDYRMAPEAPFPAAIEDGVAAYRALLESGVSPDSVVIAGDSAGGGTAVATAIKARDEGLPAAAGLALLSPWVNLSCDGWSYSARAEADPMIEQEGIEWMAATYLAGADAAEPLASPIHADLSGLPAMLIQVGPDEMLLSDSITLAERAGAAQVEVTLEIWPNMIHVFQAFYPFLPDARRAVARIGDWSAARTD